MKKIIILLITLLLCACTSKEEQTLEIIIPTKDFPASNIAADSPIKADTLDNYLFRDDCFYIDLRDPNQFYAEGHVAGFINIPFYNYIADINDNEFALFQMTKIKTDEKTIQLGDNGSFIANYNESIDLIKDIIPQDKYIFAISTAGVESAYFLNLLQQLGYDCNKLYNVGSFANGMGDDVAYMTLKNTKYLVSSQEIYDTNISFQLDLSKFTKCAK